MVMMMVMMTMMMRRRITMRRWRTIQFTITLLSYNITELDTNACVEVCFQSSSSSLGAHHVRHPHVDRVHGRSQNLRVPAEEAALVPSQEHNAVDAPHLLVAVVLISSGDFLNRGIRCRSSG